MMPRDGVACKLVIDAVGEHELDLIVWTQTFEVVPVHPMRFTASRTFDVENRDHVHWHSFSASVPSRFEQNSAATRNEPLHQRVDIILQERLATCDLHELAAVSVD